MHLLDMKKLLTLLMVAASLMLVACTEDPEVNIDKDAIDLSYKGGSFTMDVTANTKWEIICNSDDEELLTLSQWTGDPGTHTITVDVSPNESTSILKHYLTAVAHGAKRDAVNFMTVTQGAPAYVMFNKNAFTVDYIGGEFKFTVDSNFPWEITCEDEGIIIEPTSGGPTTDEDEEGDEEEETPAEGEEEEEAPGKVITVTLDDFEGDYDRSFTLNVSAAGEGTVVTDQLVITQTAPALTIGNRQYRIKKMGDGRWWMVENLCYSPKGITISDGLCGIWYPCQDTQLEYDQTTDGIISKGLLYSDAVTFNANITQTTCKRQAGAQGICPTGWHIPTLEEFMALVGKCNNNKIETIPDAPYYDAARGVGSLSKLEEGGFNTTQAGYVQGTGAGYANGSAIQGFYASRGITTTYIYCSTHYSNTQWYALVLSKPNNTANVGFLNNYTASRPQAGSVRCIKDNK